MVKKFQLFSFFILFFHSYTYAQNEVKYIWSGAVTHNSAKVNAKLSQVSASVRLVVSKNSNLSSPVYSGAKAVDSTTNLMVSLTINNLSPNTKYYYAIQSSGVTDNSPEDIGTFKTFTDGAFSYTFVVSSCGVNSEHPVFDVMGTMDPLFYLNTGDIHYANPNSTTLDPHRSAYETKVLALAKPAKFLRNFPLAHVWDDHDYSGNNSSAASIGRTSARRAYQEYVPHYPLAEGSGNVPIYQAFTVGRVRFILSDLRSERYVGSGSMMGAAQKAWFKTEVLNAQKNDQVIAWVSGVSFSGNQADNWGGFTAERTELGDFFKSNNIKNMFILSGDAHMTAIDNGNNSDFSTAKDNPNKYPIFQAAALQNTGSNKGGTYSEGVFTNPAGTGQFGTVTVTDNGGNDICFNFKGYRVLTSDGSSSVLVSYDFCRTVGTVTDALAPLKESDISLYPNPTQGKITLVLNHVSASSSGKITLTDIQDRVVHEEEIFVKTGKNAFSFDLKNKKLKGIYLLKLNLNGYVSSHKVVFE